MVYPQISSPVVSLQENPKLLSLLQDSAFREALMSRPLEVLGHHGIHVDAKDVPDQVEIPDLQAGFEQLWAGLI
jgi:hypothetical protein